MVGISLILDDQAGPEISGLYGDIRNSLRIPWTPALFQALASYPVYLNLAWRTIKPAVMTDEFRSDSFGIREAAEADVQANHRSKRTLADASAAELDDEDLDDIRANIHAFRYGNPKLFIMANALHRSLAGETVGSSVESNPADETNEERYVQTVELDMVQENEADERMLELYDEIKKTVGMPIINSDYKALARWPSFLEMAWEDLKPAIGLNWYRTAEEEILNLSRGLADDLAVPLKLGLDECISAGVAKDDLNDLADILELFASGLPGLILNISDFYLTLNDIVESDMGLRAA